MNIMLKWSVQVRGILVRWGIFFVVVVVGGSVDVRPTTSSGLQEEESRQQSATYIIGMCFYNMRSHLGGKNVISQRSSETLRANIEILCVHMYKISGRV